MTRAALRTGLGHWRLELSQMSRGPGLDETRDSSLRTIIVDYKKEVEIVTGED